MGTVSLSRAPPVSSSPQLQPISPCSLMELETETIPRKRKGAPTSALATEPDLEDEEPKAKVSKGEPWPEARSRVWLRVPCPSRP